MDFHALFGLVGGVCGAEKGHAFWSKSVDFPGDYPVWLLAIIPQGKINLLSIVKDPVQQQGSMHCGRCRLKKNFASMLVLLEMKRLSSFSLMRFAELEELLHRWKNRNLFEDSLATNVYFTDKDEQHKMK